MLDYVSTAEVSIFKPSSFYIVIRAINSNLLLEIQLVPFMQVFITVDSVFQGQTCGVYKALSCLIVTMAHFKVNIKVNRC